MNSAAKIETDVVEIPTNDGVINAEPFPVEMLWLDMETGGLRSQVDPILETGIILTDRWGNEVFRESWVHHYDASKVVIGPVIDEFVLDMHTKSGLWEECKQALPVSEGNIGRQIIKILQDYGVQPKQMELSGSTPHFDRAFIQLHMPELDQFLHYRHIDVSSFKTVAEKLNPSIMEVGPTKRELHRVMPDLEDSLTLYRFLIENFFFVVGYEDGQG